jgi:GNAT superfamily N-acetyltransferase
MTTTYDIRPATPDDTAVLATQRVAMFRDMGRTTAALEPPLQEASREYFRAALATGEYVGWIVELDAPPRTAIAGAGVQFRPLLPRTDPDGQTLLMGREGLVLNMYVDPAYRRQGIARRLMETIIEWAPDVGIGRPLYASMGFRDSNEMLYPPFPPSGSRA